MAATAIKPYPHIQMNVKDNSIYTVDIVETLPVHRPLYVMRTQKGPVGRPVWCNTYSEAAAIFGAETFNPANKAYFSKAAAFLRETFTNNGAFISRYVPLNYENEDGSPRDEKTLLDDATANILLYAVVTKSEVTQYKHNPYTGEREQYFDEASQEWKDQVLLDENNEVVKHEGVLVVYKADRITKNDHIDPEDPDSAINMAIKPVEGGLKIPIAAFKANDPGAYGNDLAFSMFYSSKSNDPGDVASYKTLFYNIGFAEREPGMSTWEPIVDIYNRENCAFAANPDTVNPDTGASMGIDNVLDNSFSDTLHQLPVNFEIEEANLNKIGLIIAAYEDDVIAPYTRDDGTPYDDPYTPYEDESKPVYAGINAYGTAMVGALSNKDKKAIKNWFEANIDSENPYTLFTNEDRANLESVLEQPNFGYMVNVMSGRNLAGQLYDNTVINMVAKVTVWYETVETPYKEPQYDPETGLLIIDYEDIEDDGPTAIAHYEYGEPELPADAVNLSMTYRIPLEGGSDGQFIPDDVHHADFDKDGNIIPSTVNVIQLSSTGVAKDNATWASDDYGMYRFLKLRAPGVRDYIVESLHYPITHLFDVGYSFKTKKAMLDFLDVRDDVMVVLSTQVLMTDGSGRSIKINDQAADEANGEALRAYALLMRESVLYGTDCMRATIYNHCGQLVNGLTTEYIPFTYWDAVQYAQYGNLPYMSQDEPRGLPNSYNLLFKNWNWWNYRADSQSRVWDNGSNYVQYADMTRIFFPALRTVYRASTSVLIDEWFVAAVIYAKYVCRRAWARFSGRNDTASVLQGAIKQYLNTELSILFNNKYSFDVSVYQTAEEQKIGYIQHVKLSITSPATMRVLDVDIEVNRENFVAEE